MSKNTNAAAAAQSPVEVAAPTISEALRLAVDGAARVLSNIETLDQASKSGGEAKKQQQAELVSLFSPLSLDETRTAVASIMKRAAESLAKASDDKRKAAMQSRVRALSRAINKTLKSDKPGTWKVAAHKAVKGLYVIEFEESTNEVEKAKAAYADALSTMVALGLLETARELFEEQRNEAIDAMELIASLI